MGRTKKEIYGLQRKLKKEIQRIPGLSKDRAATEVDDGVCYS